MKFGQVYHFAPELLLIYKNEIPIHLSAYFRGHGDCFFTNRPKRAEKIFLSYFGKCY